MTTTTNKTRTTVNANVASTTETGIDVAAKGSFAVVGAASAIIGLWATACFIGAMVQTGPLGLIKSWFTAVGM